MKVPDSMRWLFWDVEADALDVAKHKTYLIPRILEHGRFADVRWLVDTVGLGDIHEFLRDVGHPELSPRTLAFWRAVLDAREEQWAHGPAWPPHSTVREQVAWFVTER